ncbi:MAG: hypothetical protein KDK70_09395, partial [Myxococcales bacterium]|nr:hypothetical protein [Myxococcales bacterium]
VSRYGDHLTDAWLTDGRFLLGIALYVAGMALNLHSDAVLRALRTPQEVERGDKVYRIPRRGGFLLVTSPQYLGELTAWVGFALVTWSLAGVFILAISAANLVPRAIATHRWYRDRFPDYPAGRKILVPFGPEPLFHKSYGGRSGFDQEILPLVWAEPGFRGTAHVRAGPVALSNDAYAIQGYALRAPDAVLNLQSDTSALEDFRIAFGDRAGLSWAPLTAWYSFQINGLGFDQRLFMQAFDLEVWRPRGIPFVEDLVLGVGALRADVTGGGRGREYYHFGSYATIGYYPVDFLYLQYRAGLRTTDNRRGVFFDPSRLDERDRGSHNVSVLGRYKGFYAGLQLFWNLEKANEQDDDFLRLTVGYEF